MVITIGDDRRKAFQLEGLVGIFMELVCTFDREKVSLRTSYYIGNINYTLGGH